MSDSRPDFDLPPLEGVSALDVLVDDRDARLRETASYLEFVLDAFGAADYDLDVSTGILRPSRRLNALYGHQPEAEVALETLRAQYHPDDRPQLASILTDAQRTGEGQFQREFRIVRPDGTCRWVLSRGLVMFGPDGRVERVRGAAIDITERKAAEAALRYSETRCRALLDAGAQSVFRMSADMSAVLEMEGDFYAARPLARLGAWGWIRSYVHPEDRRRVRRVAEDAVRQGTPVEVELRVQRGDGSWAWTFSRAVPLRDEAGVITEWFGAATDVTERKKTEAALRELAETLEHRVVERTEELAWANEKLNAEIAERERLQAARNELRRQLVSMEEQERIRLSRELHDQMGQLVTGLLLGLKALGRSGTHDAAALRDLERLAGRIAREVHHVALELRPPALDRLGLRAAIDAHLQEWSERSGLAADFHAVGIDAERFDSEIETALYRAVQEALTNVVKHAEASRVSLVLERHMGNIGVIVEDDGRGLDPLADHGAAQNGRQLGLLGIRERVDLLGGSMEVESTPAQGTTLFVRVPESLRRTSRPRG